jgi:hypothetical protein
MPNRIAFTRVREGDVPAAIGGRITAVQAVDDRSADRLGTGVRLQAESLRK